MQFSPKSESGLPLEEKAKDKIGKLNSHGIISLDITLSRKDFTLDKPALAFGGYGSVYRGSWKNQTVAVKKLTISPEFLKEEEIIQEAEIMFRMGLESPYIVPLKKICLQPPNYYLVMKLMPKGSLHQLLNNKSQELSWLIRYQIALDVSYGLQVLHGHKPIILHRDLKSMNILLTHRLRAKLADFGLAKLKDTITSQSGGFPKGSAPYMAPELFKGNPWTTEADIYSLGKVLWELVTREMPKFTIIEGYKETIPDTCPPKLKSLIESCWDAPAKRPPVEQVVKQLESLLAAEQKSMPLPEVMTTVKAITEAEQLKLKLKSLESEKHQRKEQHRLEIQKLEKEMEEKMVQMQKEIEQLKQKNQELEQQQKELKLSPPPLPTLSTPSSASSSTSLVSTSISQILMSPPKPTAVAPNKEQLKLQDQLVIACEQGDLKAVQALFESKSTWWGSSKMIAKPDILNSEGKHPLGAAVWGMNPEVVNALLKQMGQVSPMTWAECETHNKKHYNEVFIVEKFAPLTFGEWNDLLKKIDPNPFIRAYHLQKADDQWHDNDSSCWESLRRWCAVRIGGICDGAPIGSDGVGAMCCATEAGYVGYRSQITKGIQSASQPKVGKIF